MMKMFNVQLDDACTRLRKALQDEKQALRMEAKWSEMAQHSTVKDEMLVGLRSSPYVRVVSVANMDNYGRNK